MSTFIASLETLAKKYQSLFSISIIGVIVWLGAIEWNGLSNDVSFIKNSEIPQIREDIKEIRLDIRNLDTRLTTVEVKVDLLTEAVKEIKKDMTEMREEMHEMKTELKTDIAEIKALLLKNP